MMNNQYVFNGNRVTVYDKYGAIISFTRKGGRRLSASQLRKLHLAMEYGRKWMDHYDFLAVKKGV